MKKQINYLTLFVLAIIFFASCGTSYDIAKRRYNHGYYLAKHHKPNDVIPNEKKSEHHTKPQIKEVLPIEELTSTNVQHLNPTIKDAEVRASEPTASVSKPNSDKNKEIISNQVPLKHLQSKHDLKFENASKKWKNEKKSGDSDARIILLIILALFIPPLAMYIYDKKTDFWFVLDLIFFLLLFTFLFWRLGLIGLAAILIAIFRILDLL